jgi:hypothetical protein
MTSHVASPIAHSSQTSGLSAADNGDGSQATSSSSSSQKNNDTGNSKKSTKASRLEEIQEEKEEDKIEALPSTQQPSEPGSSPVIRKQSRFMEAVDDNHSHKGSKELEDGQSEKPRPSDLSGTDHEEPWYKARRKSTGKEDPFGDEEGAEVQYKTMKWW